MIRRAAVPPSAAAPAAPPAGDSTHNHRRHQHETADVNDAKAHGTNNRAASLHDVLSIEKEQLRGLTLVALLHGFGRLFAGGGKAARDDPVGTFAHSRPVDSLDWFVSHSWSSPRVVKYLALLLCFNRRDAAVAASFATIAVFFVQALYYESLPRWLTFVGPNVYSDFAPVEISKGCTVIGCPVLLIGLFGAHRARQALGWKPVECFLDVACIPQADPAARARGISSLGALLDRSEGMLVLLDEEYVCHTGLEPRSRTPGKPAAHTRVRHLGQFTRLWCVFEIAAFAKRAGMHRVQIVQLHSALIEWSIMLAFLIVGAFFILVSGPLLPTGVGVVIGGLMLAGIMLPLMVPLIFAMIWADRSADAIERLRHFRLEDAVCQGAEDREAILALISSWYTDTSVALPRDEAVRLGHHRFEQFVRCDVRLAVKNQHVRTRFSHTTVAMILLALAPSFLDVIASPETSLITCFDMVTNMAVTVGVGFPIVAIILRFSSKVVTALDRGGLHSLTIRYAIGVLIMSVLGSLNLAVCGALAQPVQIFIQGAGYQPATDSLDKPQRQQLKLQALCLGAVWAGLRL